MTQFAKKCNFSHLVRKTVKKRGKKAIWKDIYNLFLAAIITFIAYSPLLPFQDLLAEVLSGIFQTFIQGEL